VSRNGELETRPDKENSGFPKEKVKHFLQEAFDFAWMALLLAAGLHVVLGTRLPRFPSASEASIVAPKPV